MVIFVVGPHSCHCVELVVPHVFSPVGEEQTVKSNKEKIPNGKKKKGQQVYVYTYMRQYVVMAISHNCRAWSHKGRSRTNRSMLPGYWYFIENTGAPADRWHRDQWHAIVGHMPVCFPAYIPRQVHG